MKAIVIIAVIIGAIYFLAGGVKKVQDSNEDYQNEEYGMKEKYESFNTTDSIGQDLLDVRDEDYTTQLGAWNHSELKGDFLALFPDFGEMKVFAKERIRGDALIAKLVEVVDDIEFKYFGGTIDTEQAKRKLRAIK